MQRIVLGDTPCSIANATPVASIGAAVLFKLPDGGYWMTNVYMGYDLVAPKAHHASTAIECLLDFPPNDTPLDRQVRVRGFAIRQVIENLTLAGLRELLVAKQLQEEGLTEQGQ